jgi:hypothetical protein
MSGGTGLSAAGRIHLLTVPNRRVKGRRSVLTFGAERSRPQVRQLDAVMDDAHAGTDVAASACAAYRNRRSVADGSADRHAWSSGAMSEHAGASRMPDGLCRNKPTFRWSKPE